MPASFNASMLALRFGTWFRSNSVYSHLSMRNIHSVFWGDCDADALIAFFGL
jgi:hypothetical protein